MPFEDTIAALATPSGESALALLRVSGPLSHSLVTQALGCSSPVSRRATLAVYGDLGGNPIDDVVFIYYPEDGSYTGEEMLEISSHGNPFIAGKVLEDLFARGCRPAEPGEFTRTAFLNGKIDLSQAEAVVDLIRARCDRALEIARKQLRGSVGARVNALIESLLGTVAAIEAYIDFPDEDLPAEDVEGPVRSLAQLSGELDGLIATSGLNALVHDGVRVVIIGAPNAGKSSLLNTLTGEDRVIVAPEPGTTRDFVEERMRVGRYLVRFIDTAGIHPSGSEVERKGIAKTFEQISRADMLLYVVDAVAPTPPIPDCLRSRISEIPAIIVENKVDLAEAKNLGGFLPDIAHFRVSALTGGGIGALRVALQERLEKDMEPKEKGELVLNARHAEALREAKERIRCGLGGLKSGQPTELVASELHIALSAFGSITGKIDNEAVLDKLFATFCIGK